MKILSCSVRNFASYEALDVAFESQGLTLIQGSTGSGKSTLCDAVPWVLFGTTAKGGAVIEVLTWPGDKVTVGEVAVEVGNEVTVVTRCRGPKAKDNDLWFNTGDGTTTRGKDIPDTQRLINKRLGLNSELFLSAAYYHEFSPTAQFFQAPAKNRRLLCEQLVDLSLAKDLQERLAEHNKTTSKQKELNSREVDYRERELDGLHKKLDHYEQQAASWAERRQATITQLTEKSKNFDADKHATLKALRQQHAEFEKEKASRIATLENTAQVQSRLVKSDDYFVNFELELDTAEQSLPEGICPTCGAPKHNETLLELKEKRHEMEIQRIGSKHAKKKYETALSELEELRSSFSPFLSRIEDEENRVNTHDEYIAELQLENNPYSAEAEVMQDLIKKAADDLYQHVLEGRLLDQEITDSSILQEVLADFRATLIKATISDLEAKTNSLLTKHFDAEIRVEFQVEDADKLEVSITKDGNHAVFTQLSKGQRQLLKLCFGIAVMGCISNHHGVALNTIWVDEAFDGLSDEFKLKAFGLLEALSLEYENVFVVEHSAAMKAAFNNHYYVRLEAGKSQLEKTI